VKHIQAIVCVMLCVLGAWAQAQTIMLPEAVDNLSLSITTGGNASWAGVPSPAWNGGDSAQSGLISDDQSTWMETTVQGPEDLSFYWSVSSEVFFDYLIFSVDGVPHSEISGDVDWELQTYPLGPGTHVLNWTYSKDDSLSSGIDAGWVDLIRLEAAVGALAVTIAPQGAIDAGAQWRRFGTGTWRDSGMIESDIPVGVHTLEFKDIAGWIKPSDRNVTISSSQTTIANVTYTRPGDQTVWMGVNIDDPSEYTAQKFSGFGAPVQTIGNDFDFLGSYYNLAVVGSTLFSGDFYDVYAWDAASGDYIGPLNLSPPLFLYLYDWLSGIGTTTDNDLLFASFGYATEARTIVKYSTSGLYKTTYTHPYLQYNQGTPTGNADATFAAVGFDPGSGWIEDVLMWTESGAYVGRLGLTSNVGDVEVMGNQLYVLVYDSGIRAYNLNGASLPTYTHTIPFPAGVNPSSVYMDQMCAANGELYVSDDAGDRWYKMSLTGALLGSYNAETRGIYNYVGSLAVATPATTSGSLTVTIAPRGAIDAGAQWRRAGTAAWRNSGTTESNIPVGSHWIEFREVAGWITPPSRSVTISNGQTATATGSYAFSPSLAEAVDNLSLSISTGGNAPWTGVLSPAWSGGDSARSGTIFDSQSTWMQTTVQGPTQLSLHWKVSSESDWDFLNFHIDGVLQNAISGTVDWRQQTYSLSAGAHVLRWTYMKDGSISVGSDAGWVDWVVLDASSGSLTVTIAPPAAVAAGAQWRRVGTATWLNSGSTQANIPVGAHAVEFRDVAGWVRPSNVSITIINGQPTTTSGTYRRPPNPPLNSAPVNGATTISLTPILRASAFSDPDATNSHISSQWQVRAAAAPLDYSISVFDTGPVGAALTSVQVPAGRLNYLTQYAWRVRYCDNTGLWSEWSIETFFTTAQGGGLYHPPDRPLNIWPPDSQTGVSLTPNLQASVFSDPDPGDFQTGAHWRILLESNPTAPVYDSGEMASALSSHLVPAGRLSPGISYSWQVRYRDSRNEWSAWSEETAFRTAAIGTIAVPEGLRAVPGARSVWLTWLLDRNWAVRGYYIYRATALTGSYNRLTSEPVRGSEYLDANLVPGSALFYRITAVTIGGLESEMTAPVRATVALIEIRMSDLRGDPGTTVSQMVTIDNPNQISN